MRTHPKALTIALAATGVLAVSPAQALVMTTTDVAFSNSASVTDPEGGGATAATNAPTELA